jgi:hypothetical protein
VVAINEPRKRIKRDVLRERHSESEPLWPDRQTAPGLVERGTEQGAINRVNQEAGGAPTLSLRNSFPKQRDVGVVATKDPLIQRFLRRPNQGCHRSDCSTA